MMRSSIIAIILSLIICAGTLWTTLTWMQAGETYVDLDGQRVEIQGEVRGRTDAGRFRFAVSTMWSPEETYLRYHRLGVKLGQMIEREETFVIRSSYREIREDLEGALVDAALVCTGTLLHISERDAEIMAVPEFLEDLDYRGMVIVPADSPAVSLHDLKGTVMAMTDPESFTGCILPCAQMLSVTDDLETFLQGVVFTGSHDRAVEAVAAHLAESAGVTSLIYHSLCWERPDIKVKTRVLWQSEPFGPPHILVPSGMSSEMKSDLVKALYAFHEDPQGYKILRDLKIRRFVAPAPGMYDSARAHYESVAAAGGCPWR